MTCTRCKQEIISTEQPYHRTRRGAHHAVCPPQPSEAQIQKTCTQLLELDGWRPLRTDPCSDRSRGKGFGEVGMADHLYIRYADMERSTRLKSHEQYARSMASVLWIEWKKAKGRPAAHQLAWHARERARGALTLIAGIDFEASIEGFWNGWYRTSGLMRKDIKL